MAENELFDAAATNDARTLQELLVSDPLLLDRVSFTCRNKTPLHVATMKRNLAFVQEILNRNRELAEELDSQQSSPLHIASAKGYVEIVRILLEAAPDMCLSRDSQGKNPLHLAAMKGHVHVVEELVRARPLAAGEKLDRGQNVLHLCVKHNQVESLRALVQNLNNDVVINSTDDDGNTILHLAVREKQIETIKYFVDSKKIDLHAKDSKGLTVLEILEQTSTETTNIEILKVVRSGLSNSKTTQTQPVKWLAKKRDAIMVVAILIATMAFQVGVSPPGGVWQEDLLQDSHGNPVPNPHKAGESVMSHQHPKFFKNFIRANTVAFVSSLSIILLLIGGLPFRRRLRRFFMWFLMVTMWLTVTSIAITYGLSILAVTPKKYSKSLSHVIETAITVWSGVMGILLVGNTIRLIDKWFKNRGMIIRPHRFFRNWVEVQVKHQNANHEAV